VAASPALPSLLRSPSTLNDRVTPARSEKMLLLPENLDEKPPRVVTTLLLPKGRPGSRPPTSGRDVDDDDCGRSGDDSPSSVNASKFDKPRFMRPGESSPAWSSRSPSSELWRRLDDGGGYESENSSEKGASMSREDCAELQPPPDAASGLPIADRAGVDEEEDEGCRLAPIGTCLGEFITARDSGSRSSTNSSPPRDATDASDAEGTEGASAVVNSGLENTPPSKDSDRTLDVSGENMGLPKMCAPPALRENNGDTERGDDELMDATSLTTLAADMGGGADTSGRTVLAAAVAGAEAGTEVAGPAERAVPTLFAACRPPEPADGTGVGAEPAVAVAAPGEGGTMAAGWPRIADANDR
jgi:hypothetical protein